MRYIERESKRSKESEEIINKPRITAYKNDKTANNYQIKKTPHPYAHTTCSFISARHFSGGRNKSAPLMKPKRKKTHHQHL